MLSQFKAEGFLTNYKKLTLNERIETKYHSFRAVANCTYTDFNENYLCELLPKIDRVDR